MTFASLCPIKLKVRFRVERLRSLTASFSEISLFEPLQSLPEVSSPCVRICSSLSLSSCSLQVVKLRTLFALRSFAVSSSENSPNVIITNHHAEVCLFSQQDDVSTPVIPITGKRSLFPQSHTLIPSGFPYGRLPCRRQEK